MAFDDLRPLREDPFQWLIAAQTSPPQSIRIDETAVSGLISVIVPVFNGASFLERCVRSIWNQQPPPGNSLEILVCDDGSSDDSLGIAAALEQTSPVPMRPLAHKDGVNRGVGPTRNLGIAAARGEFIALLDVDDVWLPHKLAVQMKYFAEHPHAQTVCSFGLNRDLNGASVTGWSGSEIAGDYGHPPPYTFELLVKVDPIVNSTVIVKRAALAKTGGYTAVMAHQAEDWLLFAKLALQAPIDLIEQPLIEYLVHHGSYTHRYVHSGFEYGARLEMIYQLLHWMLQHPNHRDRAQSLYRQELPALLAARPSACRLIERYYTENRDRPASRESFEAFLSRIQDELSELRHYRQHVESQLDILRRIPGAVPAYRLARAIYRRLRSTPPKPPAA
jgi:glycosyltransferase involved in cell wall biosynthesis